jgi:hypothetical protein
MSALGPDKLTGPLAQQLIEIYQQQPTSRRKPQMDEVIKIISQQRQASPHQ